MNTPQQLHDLGQSLWLDNITRGLLTGGALRRYIRDLSVTGLTSNPTIFDTAIKDTPFYDDAIHKKNALLLKRTRLPGILRSAPAVAGGAPASGGATGGQAVP